MCMFYKRLDKNTFRLPEPMRAGATVVVINERTLDDLLDGIDIKKPSARRAAPHVNVH